MSLLSALVISVGFYVMQMVVAILSKNGYIPPLAGAWTPVHSFPRSWFHAIPFGADVIVRRAAGQWIWQQGWISAGPR